VPNIPLPSTLFADCLVIVASSNRSRAENTVQVVSVGLLLNPFSYGIEHVPVDFKTLISQSWVVKNAKDITHHLIDWYSRMFPCIDDSPKTS
jgi:hypothetical protein